MERKQIRSFVNARSMHFNGLFQPLHQEKLRDIERQNQPKRLIQNQKWNSKSYSGFRVIPTKELCRVYLQNPYLLASKGILDAQATPPHSQKKGTKSMGLKIYGEIENHRKFGRRYGQQNLKLKLRNHTSVDPLKSKIGKRENSLRYFSPLGLGTGSQLRDRKKGQCAPDKKSKETKKLCDGTTVGQKKVRFVREVGSKLMVNTSRDSLLSLERICSDRFAADVKFRHVSSSGFKRKDENEHSLEYSNVSLGCQTNSGEAHQPSPVSVLEPMFYEDMTGIEKQLDSLKSESENYSDGSGMEVSSDEESVLDSETKEGTDSEPFGFFDAQYGRDSSYIDDILAEVLLGDKNWITNKRDSLDLAIIPKIFEKLEKKYYIEASWKRSERRILFDRVNLGLVEILESFKAIPTWKKPVCRRLGTVLSKCRLKQELWKALARQENRTKKESFAKVSVLVIDIDEWLELEADDESVVCELESMIVEELLGEVVSFM